MSDAPSLVDRAHKLLAISALAPALVFGVVTVAMAVAVRDTDNMLIAAGVAVVFAGIGAWTWWGTRRKPDQWQQTVPLSGVFVAFLFVMMASGSEPTGLPETAYFVAVGAVAVGLALLAWLPARRAARLVLADLSPEVVDSSLVVTFTARGEDADTLSVTPDSLEVVVRPASKRKTTRHSFPLSEVTGVATRTETDDGEHPVPGADGTSMRVSRGDVLVVDLASGPLVFAAKDVHRARSFVEARRAVVGAG
ncbi:hypothetical protein [Actinophytocola glycyrrhizae]|uniref:Uncharacterized protein n=1 Tax=Actinophytocola glycyrrhizae TaxID=2044873 RepID=A0ABV9SE55_9PSEU